MINGASNRGRWRRRLDKDLQDIIQECLDRGWTLHTAGPAVKLYNRNGKFVFKVHSTMSENRSNKNTIATIRKYMREEDDQR